MSKVIIFSRQFPKYHPKAGQPTYFVEKIWEVIGLPEKEYSFNLPDEYCNFLRKDSAEIWAKYHTIRAGNRWIVGDKFSPRVWSGKPYKSKNIIFAKDIEIKKTWKFEIKCERNSEMRDDYSNFIYIDKKLVMENDYLKLAKNDGLTEKDFCDWFNIESRGEEFKKPMFFSGQIICWNEKIVYL